VSTTPPDPNDPGPSATGILEVRLDEAVGEAALQAASTRAAAHAASRTLAFIDSSGDVEVGRRRWLRGKGGRANWTASTHPPKEKTAPNATNGPDETA
jgi:hypothetical protein